MTTTKLIDKTDEWESKIDQNRQVVPNDTDFKVTDKRGQPRQSDYHERLAETIKQVAATEPTKTLEEQINECVMNPGPGRVIVAPDKFVYKGKLTIPDNAKRSGSTGVILKVGYHCTSQFFDDNLQAFRGLQPGDRVAYGTWTGTLFNFDQKPAYRVLADDDIATIVTDKAAKLLDVEA